jgi:hypothetical protein
MRLTGTIADALKARSIVVPASFDKLRSGNPGTIAYDVAWISCALRLRFAPLRVRTE